MLYRKAVASVGWDKAWLPAITPKGVPRAATLGYLMAREFGDHTTARRLGRALDRMSNGRFFNAGDGGDGAEAEEFGYFFGFGEAYPRGQESALLMLRDVAEPGDWCGAFNEIDTERHGAPTVEGVDFPRLGVCQAANDAADGVLTVQTYAASRAASGESTRWRVTNLPDAHDAAVELDGRPFGDWRALDDHSIELSCRIAEQTFRIRTGRSSGRQPAQAEARATPSGRRKTSKVSVLEIVTARQAVTAGAAGCPCCA
jgi:hypothetical protein